MVLLVKLRNARFTRIIKRLYHLIQRLGIYKTSSEKSEHNEWVIREHLA